MSRSYKKTPIFKCNTRQGKKLANQRVRAYLKRGGEIANGNAYKKVFQSYNISDYETYETLNEAIIDWERNEKYYELGMTKWRYSFDEAIYWWRRSYQCK